MSCDEICRNVVVMIGTVVFLLIETSQICSFRIGRTRSRSIRSIDRDPLIYSIVETTSLIGLRAECFACLLRSMGKLARVAFDRQYVRNCRECESKRESHEDFKNLWSWFSAHDAGVLL